MEDDLRRAVSNVLALNGIVEHPATPEEAEAGIHSWRCGYPNLYMEGRCSCFADLVDDLLDVLR